MSKLDEWEAEARESIQQSKDICEINSEDELNWNEMCFYEQRILTLIDLIRKKDEALKKAIAAFGYAWEDMSDQYYQNKITEAKEAIALTEELK